jgi:serine/threonine-protein kinase
MEQCPRCGEPVNDDLAVCPRCSFIKVAEAEDMPGDLNPEDNLPPGTVIENDYRIVSVIGSGGSGVVYEARQLSLQNARVALKVLHPDLSDDETTVTLLKREVIVSRELTHHNIMKVYNFVQARDRYFIVMEYVLGGSLQSRLESMGPMGLEKAAQIFFQACDALEYAHNRGVIHLDIKPANILIGPNNMVKLCDFGIARMAVSNVTTATQRIITGSVGYMPPEQYRGRKFVSTRSDIYSLAATFYTALTGEAPIGIIDREGLPDSIIRAMHRDPEQRFESVDEFKRTFIQETDIEPISPTFMGAAPSPQPEPSKEELGAAPIETRVDKNEQSGTTPDTQTRLGERDAEPDAPAVSKAVTVAPSRDPRMRGRDTASILKTKSRHVRGRGRWAWVALALIIIGAGGYYYLEGDITGIVKKIDPLAEKVVTSPGQDSPEPPQQNPSPGKEAARIPDQPPITDTPPVNEDLLEVMTKPADEALAGRIKDMVSAFEDSLNFDQENQAVAFLSNDFKQSMSEAAFRKEFFGVPRLWRIQVTHVGSTEEGDIVASLKVSVLDSFHGSLKSGEAALRFVKKGSTFKISRLQLERPS